MTDPAPYLEASEATWPPARLWRRGRAELRDGAGGGKRVSAATLIPGWGDPDIDAAEADMRARNMDPLFMVRPGEAALDAELDARGYRVLDPTGILVAPLASMAARPLPRLAAFPVWPPLGVMEDLWAEAGIGPARRAVMARAKGPATAILARTDDRASGVGFVAVHGPTAMVHALEVKSAFRRRKVAVNIMSCAARWAQDQDAENLAVLCVRHNSAAKALYSYLGFNDVGQYHYRVLKSEPSEQE